MVRIILVLIFGISSYSFAEYHLGGSGGGGRSAIDPVTGRAVPGPCVNQSAASNIANPPRINTQPVRAAAAPAASAAVPQASQAAAAPAASGSAAPASSGGAPAGGGAGGTPSGSTAAATGGGSSGGSGSAAGGGSAASTAAPSTDPEAVKRGEAIMSGKCQECHGAKPKAAALAWANGGDGPMKQKGGAPEHVLKAEELNDLKAYLSQ